MFEAHHCRNLLSAVALMQMTQTPFYEPRKPLSKAEREARDLFRNVDAKRAMTEHEVAKKAFSDNYERLKAERRAREAAAPQAD